VHHSGDARQQAVISATKFYEAIAALLSDSGETEPVFTNLSVEQPPEVNEHVRKRMGIFPSSAELLGRRTGLMHEALIGSYENKPFTPEPYSMLFQRSLFQSLQATIKRALASVRRAMKSMDEETLALAENALGREEKLYSIVSVLKRKQFKCSKIRIHGDYALDQLLNLGNDYAVKDFEGHGELAISERRLKRSPLRDVASLIYSLHDAALVALYDRVKISPEGLRDLEPWATEWWMASSSAFLGSYYEKTVQTGLVPASPTDFLELLRVFLIDRASRDLIESTANRPEGISVGLRALIAYTLLDGIE
jgi:maltose alpha-D-glucosyltransferase/alpha-amylase